MPKKLRRQTLGRYSRLQEKQLVREAVLLPPILITRLPTDDRSGEGHVRRKNKLPTIKRRTAKAKKTVGMDKSKQVGKKEEEEVLLGAYAKMEFNAPRKRLMAYAKPGTIILMVHNPKLKQTHLWHLGLQEQEKMEPHLPNVIAKESVIHLFGIGNASKPVLDAWEGKIKCIMEESASAHCQSRLNYNFVSDADFERASFDAALSLELSRMKDAFKEDEFEEDAFEEDEFEFRVAIGLDGDTYSTRFDRSPASTHFWRHREDSPSQEGQSEVPSVEQKI